jgi:hypothetical protein
MDWMDGDGLANQCDAMREMRAMPGPIGESTFWGTTSGIQKVGWTCLVAPFSVRVLV